MNADDYKKAALRTENTPNFVCKNRDGAIAEFEAARLADLRLSRILHAVLGMITELGELCDPLKRHLIYGAPLDVTSNDKGSMREELGDSSWYSALLADALDAKLADIWERNIAKLRERFPAKFSEEKALNRNLEAEQRALREPGAENDFLRALRDARTRMMEEICALKPAERENDARAILEWRLAFERELATKR